jgi:glycosyltransferase involved in cell wall biosynthesis
MQNTKMRVLVISPQFWGTMRITKHHYAIELAKIGHEVYFLEPLALNWNIGATGFKLKEVEYPNLKVISHTISAPSNLKFHAKRFFDFFMKRHIQKLEKRIGGIDLVWSFDLTGAISLKYFSATQKIFFAADWPPNKDAVNAADSADLVISVAQEILDQYPNKYKKLLVNHGVAECFIDAGKIPFVKSDEQFRIGMSGNFLRPDIDRPVLLDIIASFPDILFECFGAYEPKNSNLGGSNDSDTARFIEALKTAPNVVLKGMVSPEELAVELRRMDAFLICYDVEKDQSKGTNYHKVSEYLVYGNLIVSNYVSAYDFEGSGVTMTKKSNSAKDYIELIRNGNKNQRLKSMIFGYDSILNTIFFNLNNA